MAFSPPTDDFFQTQRVDKPWGHETCWAYSERYVGKILHVSKGHSLSLQYHEKKDETISVLKGQVEFDFGPHESEMERRVLEAGDCIRVRPGQRHRMTALTDCELIEVSTPELDDVVRLEDRYGREGTSEA